LFAAAFGLAILGAGLVALLLLPLPLLAPLWMARAPLRQWSHWYRGLAVGLAGAAILSLAWLIPVVMLPPGEAGRPPGVHSAFTFSDSDRRWSGGLAMSRVRTYPWWGGPPLWRPGWRQWRLFGEPAMRSCLVAAAVGLGTLILGSRNADSILCALPPLALIVG